MPPLLRIKMLPLSGCCAAPPPPWSLLPPQWKSLKIHPYWLSGLNFSNHFYYWMNRWMNSKCQFFRNEKPSPSVTTDCFQNKKWTKVPMNKRALYVNQCPSWSVASAYLQLLLRINNTAPTAPYFLQKLISLLRRYVKRQTRRRSVYAERTINTAGASLNVHIQYTCIHPVPAKKKSKVDSGKHFLYLILYYRINDDFVSCRPSRWLWLKPSSSTVSIGLNKAG